MRQATTTTRFALARGRAILGALLPVLAAILSACGKGGGSGY